MALQHIVLFNYPGGLSTEDDAEMRRQVEGWHGVIPGINALRLGSDITQARTQGYQYLLYTEFDDEDTLRAYQGHPVHQAFLKWVIDRNCTVVAFDYHLTDRTVII